MTRATAVLWILLFMAAGSSATYAERILQRHAFGPEWASAVENESWWLEKTSKAFSSIRCCAYCGECDFARTWVNKPGESREIIGGVYYEKTPTVPGPPPYAAQCPVLAANCVVPSGKWNVCGTCNGKKGPATRAPLQTSLTAPYVEDFLKLSVTFAQMLSVVDVSVQFESKYKGYLHGNVIAASHFDSPLLIYDVRCASFDTPPPQDLLDFYALRMCDNPVTTKYVPLIERPIPTFGVPYVQVADILSYVVASSSTTEPADAWMECACAHPRCAL